MRQSHPAPEHKPAVVRNARNRAMWWRKPQMDDSQIDYRRLIRYTLPHLSPRPSKYGNFVRGFAFTSRLPAYVNGPKKTTEVTSLALHPSPAIEKFRLEIS